jgi:aspartate/glutamate racemase
MANEDKIQGIILGCIELPLLFKVIDPPEECFDTMQIHIRTLIDMIVEN